MTKKQQTKRALNYEKKLKIDGTFDQVMKELVKEPKEPKEEYNKPKKA